MPIEREDLEAWIADNGRELHHVTAALNVPEILRSGLDTRQPQYRSRHVGFFRPRAGRVYLATPDSSPVVELQGRRAYVAVDVTKLDPQLMDPDEDQVQESFLSGKAGWLDVPPPRRRLDEHGHERPGQTGRLAHWADTTPGFDAPAITHRSLARGSVAYRGQIPPSALCEVRPVSVALGRFHERAATLPWLGALPAAPQLEVWKLEIERAKRLARAVTSLVIALDSTQQPPPVSRPEHFLDVAQRLSERRRKLLRELDDITAVSLLELVNAAVSLAAKASELTEISWTTDLETCRSVGELAAETVVAAERCLDRHEAARIAQFSVREAGLAMP